MMDSDLPPGSCNSTGHLSTIGYHSLPGRMHHSASTPAGVDGAGGGGGGGGSRTPPATPKKGGKMLAVRVQMLDDSISMFQIQSKALARVLFEQVCRQLHLLEADYFGLEYEDLNGTKYWLDVEKPICRQVGLSMLEPMVRFCVKFYTPDPARLEEEFTRYLFCLQVKRDLAQGCIHCNENTAALMASYIVQAECGDFVPEDYPDHTYLSGYKFFPGQDSESERRIMENHKKHTGQSPAEADLNLLETARRCELYGIKLHPARDHENVALSLAAAHLGIVVFQHYTKINTFSWAKIRKISFKRKRFLIKLHSEGYGYFRDVVEFFFEGRNECKNFWKKCVENHGFFRCTSVPRIARHKTRVMSRGSSFRYSGRTQKQIVEYVRDNYVKRQTFQRSASFRASRSLRSSRVYVNTTPMTASVSAHPLLPLPPGSDAISLEWDKQPHYLEASLMMKGYSAETARQVAARPRAAATACATIRDKQQVPELVTHAEVNHHPTEDSPLPHRTMTPLGSPENTWILARSEATAADTPERARTPPRVPPPRASDAEETSPEDDHTISSASLLLSPQVDKTVAPLYASTPLQNGVKLENNVNCDIRNDSTLNGNVTDGPPKVSQSTHSIDVLSAGESDAGDTLTRSRQNNNSSISSVYTGTMRDGADKFRRRGPADCSYLIAKELLMTERTYKRDLELLTVTWSIRVSALAHAGTDCVSALGRPCLALEPIALSQGPLLVRLERCLGQTPRANDNEEPEYKKIADILYDYLSNTCDAYSTYTSRAGLLVARLESARRSDPIAEQASGELDECSPLPLSCLLLRPLHRLMYYAQLTADLSQSLDTQSAHCAHELASELAQLAEEQLRHAENHAALCQLQRDIIGYDKLLVADREFIRLGCVYKHSSKGLQQRMLFLFNDVLVCASKSSGSAQYRAHCVMSLPRIHLEPCDHPHSFTLAGDDLSLTLSTSNEQEFVSWCEAIQLAIEDCDPQANVDTELSPYEQPVAAPSPACGVSTSGGGALTHVCWHRAVSLSRDHLHLAMRMQLSGYLLRKFKNSHGWQKLWVVFAAFALFFYKSWQDETPLASLPLLGYSVGAPAESDAIHKEFVFKLQFKNHVYFFRADTNYTYHRWTEALQSAMLHAHHN